MRLKDFLTGKSKYRSLAVFILLLIGSRLFLFEFTGYIADDAFITYRYAENLNSGHGFVYNVGEKVQGTSSPLFTILLAAVAFVIHPSEIPAVSRLIALLADGISLILLWHLLSSWRDLSRFLVLALFALYPKVVLIGISGMEAPLVLMLMLLSLYLLHRGSLYGGSLCFGLLLLCRLDAIIWVFVCILWAIQIGKKIPWTTVLTAVLPYSLWVAFAALYFGTFVPYAIIAKRVSLHHLFPAFDPLRILLGYLPFEGLRSFPYVSPLVTVLLFLLPLFVVLMYVMRCKDILMVFPIFFVVYNLIFSFGRVIMADWYLLPGYAAYFVTVGYCVELFLQGRQGTRIGRLGTFVLKFSSILLLVLLLCWGAVRWKENPAGLGLRQNKQLGNWLREHASPTSHVLVEPIGYVGWQSKLYIDDYIALVSPVVISYRQRYPESDAWFMEFLRERRPDYVVFRNWETPRNALFQGHGDGLFHTPVEREWFRTHYVPVEWNPGAALRDSVYLVLYQLKQQQIDMKERGE
jgi:hypothetical protein